MKQGLQLRLSQQLAMTPQLQQAIRLLQLSTLELQQEIQLALESNPLLEQSDLHDEIDAKEASDSEAQQLLLDAYESGEIKGQKVTVVRKLLEQRERSGKQANVIFARGSVRKQMTPEELAKLYKRDAEMHKRIQKKAEYTQQSLLLIRQIFKELFADKEFCELLQAEHLTSIPQPLADLLPGR